MLYKTFPLVYLDIVYSDPQGVAQLFSFYLILCQFQHGVAYKEAYIKNHVLPPGY